MDDDQTSGVLCHGPIRTSAPREAEKLKTLSLINWTLLTLSVLTSVIGAAICLLTWPFPHMGGEGGTTFGDVLTATTLGVLIAITAACSTWLLVKRHPALWLGQGLLAVVIVGSLIYSLAPR